MDVFLARGADPTVKDPRGETAFDGAERVNRTGNRASSRVGLTCTGS